MKLDLKGKKAIVTGATRGIGRAIAERLAEEGVDIAICAREAAAVDSAVTALGAKGVKAIGQAVDLADATAYKNWLQHSAQTLGGVDIFVPNVAVAGGDHHSEEDWRRQFDISLMGAVRGCESLLPYLQQSGAAAIVLISSIAAIEHITGPANAYNCVKASLINYGGYLSRQFASEGIRVNSISPGAIYHQDGGWQQIERDQPELFNDMLAKIPLGRMGRAEEVANAVAFLASPVSGFTSGTNLIIDGAMSRGVQY